jgi:hypothetical protein
VSIVAHHESVADDGHLDARAVGGVVLFRQSRTLYMSALTPSPKFPTGRNRVAFRTADPECERRRSRRLVFCDARDSAPGPQGRLNRPSSTISPGVGRRRRPIDGLSISQTDSYVAKRGGCLPDLQTTRDSYYEAANRVQSLRPLRDRNAISLPLLGRHG